MTRQGGPSGRVIPDNNSRPSNSSAKSSRSSPSGGQDAKEECFWHVSMSTDPPANYTPKLINILENALIEARELGRTQRAVLCSQDTVHIATEPWDMGWGCGYRNFLMSCTALMSQHSQPLYFPLLDDPWPPSVRNLQRSIEKAWKDGYDPQGARQLKQKLVGTRKWIGTAELYVAFISRGIPVNLVDFPKSPRGVQPLLDWVIGYFGAASGGTPSVLTTDKMPLILQHQGHSRTIVGYELQGSGQVNLLVFDPSRKPPRLLRNAEIASPGNKLTNYFKKMVTVQSKHEIPLLGTRKRKHECPDIPTSESRKPKGSNAPSAQYNGEGEVTDRFAAIEGPEKLSALMVLQHFVVSTAKLRQKNRYQILWFPLSEPLDVPERWERREVKSDRIT